MMYMGLHLLVEQPPHFLYMKGIVKIEDYDQLLGQIGHAVMKERQLVILGHVNVKAKVSKIAVVAAKVEI